MFFFVAGGCKCYSQPCCPSSICVCAILYNFAMLENKCMYVTIMHKVGAVKKAKSKKGNT